MREVEREREGGRQGQNRAGGAETVVDLIKEDGKRWKKGKNKGEI